MQEEVVFFIVWVVLEKMLINMDTSSHEIEITLEYPVSVETILNVSFNYEGFRAIFEFILDILRKHEARLKNLSGVSPTDPHLAEEIEKIRQELARNKDLTDAIRKEQLLHSEKLETLQESQLSAEEKQRHLQESQESIKNSLDSLDESERRLEASVHSLENSQSAFHERISAVEFSNQSLTVSSNSHERALEGHSASLQEIYSRLDKNEEEISKQLRSLESFNKQLSEESSRIDKNDRSISDAKEKLERHTNTLNDHETRLHQLETDIDQAMRAIKSLGGEVQQISKPIEPVLQEVGEVHDSSSLDPIFESIRDLSRHLKELDLRLGNTEDATVRLRELSEKTESSSKRHESEIREHEESIRRLEDMWRKGRPEGKPSESRGDASRDDLEALRKQIKALEDSLKKKANLSDIDNLRHEPSGAPGTDLKALRELQHRVDELQKQLQDLASRPSEGGAKASDVKLQRDMQARLDELEKLLHGLSSGLDELGSRLSVAEVSLSKKVGKPELDELRKLIASMEGRPSLRGDETLDASKLVSLSRRLGAAEDHLKLLVLPEGHDIVAIFNILLKLQVEVKEGKEKSEKMYRDFMNKFREFEDALAKKASIEDLRALEEMLKGMIKDLGDEFNKKFAEKIETKRALKYLEKQIREQDTFKAIPEGDEAMLARKPLGGWSCASCQKELEKLMGKVAPYQPWNKMPYRDPADRIARAGPGFSRMLATIQPDSLTNRTRNSAFRNNSPPSHVDEDVVESVTLPPVNKTSKDRPLTTL